MKFFIVFACALAAASAGYVHPVVYAAQHLPVIGSNGVPVDTADVQIARAAHAVHKVDSLVRNGDLYHGVVAHATPVVSTYAAHSAPLVSAYATHGVAHVSPLIAAHGVAAYPTTAVHPTNINGTPLETPEVVAAKINHFAAHAEAAARNVHALHYRKRRGILAASPIGYSAVASPVVSTYSHAPVISAYAHAPVVASTYAHSPLVASSYSAHPLAYSANLVHHY